MTLMHEVAPPPADDEQPERINITDHNLVMQALANQSPEAIRGLYQMLRAHESAHHHGEAPLPDTDQTYEQLMTDYMSHPEHQDD